jgi:hypothetical protein
MFHFPFLTSAGPTCDLDISAAIAFHVDWRSMEKEVALGTLKKVAITLRTLGGGDGSQGLRADWAGGLLAQPAIQTIAMKLMFARQAAQDFAWNQLLQADWAPRFLLWTQSRWPNHSCWDMLNLLRTRACTVVHASACN